MPTKKFKPRFKADDFYRALDAERLARGKNWKGVADESGVSASTLTRLAQGKRPDVDSMAALLGWAGLSADPFLETDAPRRPAALTELLLKLREDSSLTADGAAALEAVIKASYENLRRR